MNRLTLIVLKLGVTCLIIVSSLLDVCASHNVGCTITYICTSGNIYDFKMICFRDCSGITMPTTVVLNFSSSTCGTTSDLTLNYVPAQSGIDVSQLCSSATSNCQGGVNFGVEQWVYSGTKTLSAGCVWTASYNTCCRGSIVNNLQNASSQGTYVSTTINTNLATCNNSVEFNNLPILYTCDSSLTYYNHGAFDPDGDSLIFTLVAPMDDNPVGTALPFVVGLSDTMPLFLVPTTNFGFSTTTGQMIFRPQNNLAQVAMIGVRVDEVRNGVIIATTFREVQVVVSTNCQSSPPIVDFNGVGGSAINISGTNLNMCRSNFATFELLITDPNADSLTISSNIGLSIPNGAANYTINPISRDSVLIILNVNSLYLNPGVYPFGVNINNNNCPIPTVQFIGYTLTVLGVSYPNLTFCQSTSNPTPIILGASMGMFTQLPTNPLGLVLDSITGVVDIMASALGTYSIIYNVDSTAICPSDTLTLSIVANVDPSFSYPKNSWCKQDSNLIPTITGTMGGLFSSTTLGTALNPNTGGINLATANVGNHTINYRVDNGCVGQDSFVVNVIELKNFKASSNLLFHCSNQNDTIQLGTVAIYDGTFPTGVTYDWTPNFNINNPNIANPQVYVDGVRTYYLEYNDGICPIQQDSISIDTFSHIALLPTADTTICWGTNASIGAGVLLGTGNQIFASTGASTLFVEDTTVLTINVTGLSPTTISNELMARLQLCMNLNVGYIGRLKIFLKSPSGHEVPITSNHGGLATSLINATFSIDPNNLSLGAYTGPFPAMPANASFWPMGGATGFKGLLGATTNGVWTLTIIHNNSGLSSQNGSVSNWCLNFRDPAYATFSWTPSNSIISCANCDTAIVNPNDTTIYSVVATHFLGCKDTAYINVKVTPEMVFTATTSAVTCQGCTDGFAAAFVFSPGIISYLWGNGQTTYSLTGLTAGQYCVTITANGCEEDTCVQVNDITSNYYHNKHKDELIMSIFDNPITTNIASVIINTSKETKASIHIFTIDAKEVVTLSNQQLKVGENILEIPMNNLTSGLFTIVLRTNNQTLQQKVIIQN